MKEQSNFKTLNIKERQSKRHSKFYRIIFQTLYKFLKVKSLILVELTQTETILTQTEPLYKPCPHFAEFYYHLSVLEPGGCSLQLFSLSTLTLQLTIQYNMSIDKNKLTLSFKGYFVPLRLRYKIRLTSAESADP